MDIKEFKEKRRQRKHNNTNRYKERIETLKNKGREVSHIEKGIGEIVQVLENKRRSFVIYGEPQSGKTEAMIALTCKLLDLRYKTIFILMNDNTELEQQNFDRFRNVDELNPAPERDINFKDKTDKELKSKSQRVIFCRKNSNNLKKLIEKCRFIKGERVIIDDEADYATPNAKINKEEVTRINELVGKLGDLDTDGIYIGVTATPARLDLNNTYYNNSRDWIYLDTHSYYKGRSFFFPKNNIERSKTNYILKLIPDEHDKPEFLRRAVYRFLCRVALLNLNEKTEQTSYSMLIHTGGGINDHSDDKKELNKILNGLKEADEQINDQNETFSFKYDKVLTEFMSIAAEISADYTAPYSAGDIASYVFDSIGKKEILTINHKNDKNNVVRACEPKVLFTFCIGGNIVSRGLTFDRLLSFFFSRSVKNKLQQNTYIQRARMFGTRPYSKYFELCIPEELFHNWANCFHDHEISVTLGKAGAYQHIESGKTAAVDRPSIDLANVTIEQSERTVGEIFALTPEIEQIILNHDVSRPLSLIESLMSKKLISGNHFPEQLLKYIKEVTGGTDQGTYLVLVKEREKNTPAIEDIEGYKDGNSDTITRKRGGIVHAILNRRKEYSENMHFILPIRSTKNNKMRFLYKSKLGHKILQNMRETR